jgi:hypothetical protein
METKSLKALALKVLAGNQQGKSQESKSFPRGIQEGNPSKSFPVELPRVGNQETPKNETIRAQGYGCGCGHNLYQQVEEFIEESEDTNWEHQYRLSKVWQCENCKAIYEIIGGTRGPLQIQ